MLSTPDLPSPVPHIPGSRLFFIGFLPLVACIQPSPAPLREGLPEICYLSLSISFSYDSYNIHVLNECGLLRGVKIKIKEGCCTINNGNMTEWSPIRSVVRFA